MGVEQEVENQDVLFSLTWHLLGILFQNERLSECLWGKGLWITQQDIVTYLIFIKVFCSLVFLCLVQCVFLLFSSQTLEWAFQTVELMSTAGLGLQFSMYPMLAAS